MTEKKTPEEVSSTQSSTALSIEVDKNTASTTDKGSKEEENKTVMGDEHSPERRGRGHRRSRRSEMSMSSSESSASSYSSSSPLSSSSSSASSMTSSDSSASAGSYDDDEHKRHKKHHKHHKGHYGHGDHHHRHHHHHHGRRRRTRSRSRSPLSGVTFSSGPASEYRDDRRSSGGGRFGSHRGGFRNSSGQRNGGYDRRFSGGGQHNRFNRWKDGRNGFNNRNNHGKFVQQQQQRVLKEFFSVHNQDGWFIETYSPEFLRNHWQESAKEAADAVKVFAEEFKTRGIPPCDVTLYKQEDSTEMGDGDQSSLLPMPHPCQNVLEVKVVPRSWSVDDISAVFKDMEGYIGVTLSEPKQDQDYVRVAWILFSTAEACDAALVASEKATIHETPVKAEKYVDPDPSKRKVKLCPPECSAPACIHEDVGVAEKLCQHMNEEKGLTFSASEVVGSTEWEAMDDTHKLDFWIHYLRTVHHFCFYCGEEFANAACMLWKCGPCHLRSAANPVHAESTLAQLQNPWLIERDKKLQIRLNIEINSRTFDTSGDELVALKAFHDRNTIKIAEDKFGCVICQKRFASIPYLEKHHLFKHSEEIEKVKRAVVVARMEASFLSRMSQAVMINNSVLASMSQFSKMTLIPGPSQQRLTGSLLNGQRVYDAFLAVASLSEPQHTIYGLF